MSDERSTHIIRQHLIRTGRNYTRKRHGSSTLKVLKAGLMSILNKREDDRETIKQVEIKRLVRQWSA